jgi:hypothetical protein
VKIKETVKLSLYFCLTEHHAMKAYWGTDVRFHAFLTSKLGGSEWIALRPAVTNPF